ncbi:MAG: hypothetical protein BVN35_11455 [Proteobacteria bacterium ST_bin11]|jgi:transmembrane sensor|nr:MAG: hypothetical protein BVN35_11455 [Proteobacteria bacterium ST_bin11]
MQKPKVSPEHQTLEQAATWFVELQSEYCDDQRREAFQQWLLQHPSHQRAYDDIAGLWGNLDTLKNKNLESLNAGSCARPVFSRTGKIITGGLLLAAIGIGAWLDFKAPTTVYQTAIGERQTVQLADGSQLQLNTATQLRVCLSWWRREIQLQHGEAMFNVAHQAWPPFTVNTGNLKIRDLGTVFDVRHDALGTAVSVLEGEVTLHADSKWFGENLAAGFRRKIDQNGHWQKPEKTSAEQAGAWINGHLLFEHTPLSEVAAELERYHAVRFAFADPALARETVSGSFNITDLKPFLHALEKILPIRLERQKQTVVLYSR